MPSDFTSQRQPALIQLLNLLDLGHHQNGESGIRTHESLRPTGFQDRRHRIVSNELESTYGNITAGTSNSPSSSTVIDADLSRVVDARPRLSDAIKAALLAMVEAGSPDWSER